MSEQYYKAYVDVFDETYYVDSYTGEGFDQVLSKIEPLINKEASTMYIPSFNFDDAKSELMIIAIEGIRAFDPHREVKLSTFLIRHINNKKISKIRSENKMSNDAFSFFDEGDPENKNKIKRVREEIHFSQFTVPQEGEGVAFEHTISEDGLPGTDSSLFVNRFEKSDFETSLVKICSKLDNKTRKIIELIYFEDYSIKDAAEEVGLSGWAASMRLKKLSERGTFRNIFGIDPNIAIDQSLYLNFEQSLDDILTDNEGLENINVGRCQG